MAEKKTNKAVRYDNPVEITGTTTELPPTNRESAVAKLVDHIVAETKGKDDIWVTLDPAGRKPSTVQSSIQGAGERRGVKIQTRTRGGVVYARVVANAKKG